MKKISLSALLVSIAIVTMPLLASGRLNNEELIDSLRGELARIDNPRDSISLLYDILDLSRYGDREAVGEQLLAAAQHGGDIATQYDVMRRLGSMYGSHNKYVVRINELVNLVASMPLSNEQRMTLAFLRVQANVSDDKGLTDIDRQKRIHDLIRSNGISSKDDPYDRVEYLFTLCRYLQNDVNGEMLSKYLEELGHSLNELPGDNTPLVNLYYVQASLVYTVSSQKAKAVEASRGLLNIIDQLENNSRAEGHRYRNYDVYRYIALRRLLTNFQVLSDDEIDSYYNEIQKLAEINQDVKNDIEGTQRTLIYYLMGKGRYREALDLMKKQVDNPLNKPYLIRMYPYMIEAAKALNDKDALLKASLGHNELLVSILEGRSQERSYEMEMLNEMQDITGSNNDLLAQQRESTSQYHRSIIKVALIAGGILLIVIVGLLFLYRKARILSLSLGKTNENLVNERDTLQRTQQELISARDHARRADRHKAEFINNMSHEIRTPLNALVECSHLIVDNVSVDKRQYLKKYADMIDVSADMLSSIVEDVLDIAAMDNSQIQVERKAESVNAICRIAVDNMRKHCKPGVTMSYLNNDDEDLNIVTDVRRVEQVLINMLSNGAKFTDEGYVNLYYTVSPMNQTITFVVEDSGIGVPKGKEEVIFERFEKLSNLTAGTGLGLNISRMMAELLGGTIVVDTTYAGPGARFLFTLPM